MWDNEIIAENKRLLLLELQCRCITTRCKDCPVHPANKLEDDKET